MTDAIVSLINAEHGARELAGTVDGGRVLVDADGFAALTGWTLKAEGWCRGEVCVPVRDRTPVAADGRIDVAGFGAALSMPTVVDAEERVVALGERADTRAAVIATGDAPDFELPDLEGRPFRFSSIGRKKKLLLAWASW
ncbi:MAG: hypothetical protein FJW88_14560 [Actinobacteria bacterium]|nr:hypothetical protein [Actinomycetota bacterium]